MCQSASKISLLIEQEDQAREDVVGASIILMLL